MKAERIPCSSCYRETIEAEACKCCMICEDPEPLCDLCAHRHTLKKGNKGHRMTDNLRQFLNQRTIAKYV